MIRGTDKDLARELRDLERAGFQIERTRKNHIKVVAPDGARTVIGFTVNSPYRAVRRLRSWARRHP